MQISCIYAIINKINGMIYIGKTINFKSRMDFYKNNNHSGQKKLYNATKKYGWNNFSIEIIEKCNKDQLSIREKYWIRYLNTFDIYDVNMGYNLTSGGDGFGYGESNPNYGRKTPTKIKHSEESKKKISLAQIGNKNHRYGKHQSIELNNKQSERMKGRNNPMFGKISKMKGKIHSEEAKRRISEAQKKRWNKK